MITDPYAETDDWPTVPGGASPSAPEASGDAREAEGAREAAYAEAIDNLTFASRLTDAAWLDEVTAAVMAVADAERAADRAEIERMQDNLSALLCDLTGGRLSKTTYDVPTMVQAVEEYFDEQLTFDLNNAGHMWKGAHARAELAEAERDRLREAVEALADREDARVAEANARLDERRETSPKTGRPWRVVGMLTTAEVRAVLADAAPDPMRESLERGLAQFAAGQTRRRDDLLAPDDKAERHHHSRKAMECVHVGGDCCTECCEPGGVIER